MSGVEEQPTSLINTLLLLSALLMGYSDLATTNEILRLGGGEANPFMRFVQDWLGVWWFIPKLGLTLAVMWLLYRGENERHIAIVVGFLAAPVFSNLALLGGMKL